ncbi:MAG TPA: hypothetical protein VG318_09410 [Actinomycetota bacterium]|nr:hypothetical protein [Actinomycetota bacterium]
MSRGRLLAWVAVGAAAVAAVMLKDVSGLLADVQTAGARSYSADVFTGWHLDVIDTTQLRDAITLWRSAQERGLDIERLILWHVVVDLVLFIPASAAILRWILLRVRANPTFTTVVVVWYVMLDLLETLTAGIVLVGGSLRWTSAALLVPIQVFGTLKWLVIAIAFVAIVGRWRQPGGASLEDVTGSVRRAHAGEERSPALALAGVIVLVVVYVATVALPGGGALDQLPDVIRQHLSEGSFGLWALSTLGFLLFLAAIAVASLAATSPGGARAVDGRLTTGRLLRWVAPVSAGLFVLARLVDGEWRAAPLAPVVLVLVLAGVDRLASAAGVKPAARSAPEGRVETDWSDDALRWTGGVTGVAALAGTIGLVRAAFPPFVLELPSGRLPWGLVALAGTIGALVVGVVVQRLVEHVARGLPPPVHRTLAVVTVGCVIAAAAWLAIAPAGGRLWGSTGVVGVGFSIWILVVGLLTWFSRTRPPWDVTERLGFGARTPWLTLLVVTWLLAAFIGRDAGYNDARLLATTDPAPRYATLEDAFDTWVAASREACDAAPGGALPMVFVAAPGGGIRAAYWTVGVLDKLFSPESGSACAATRAFALSGVSGGSVGIATWVTATGRGESPRDAITDMSRDEPLPRAIAGLLLRDLPQPLTGIADGWDDRAGLLERGWAAASGVFGTSEDPLPWSAAGEGGELPFVPVISLNGSSVTDACRVLVTNVGQLPATLGPDCQGVPAPGHAATGPLSGSIDPFVGLTGDEDACGPARYDVPITTGALLSARFPVVSPAGSLTRCVDGEETDTDVVDGGYYENSGLLTLLQLWEGLEEYVADYNEATPEAPVEPWFLVADNHYRALAKRTPPGRPIQLLAPLEAKSQDVLSQTMLEQAAVWSMRTAGVPRFARLAPTVNPGVEAPLGWVLSSASRENLDRQLCDQLRAPDESLAVLLDALGTSVPSVC